MNVLLIRLNLNVIYGAPESIDTRGEKIIEISFVVVI